MDAQPDPGTLDHPEPQTPVPDTPGVEMGRGFADLGLDHRLLQALIDLGYEEPTAIQREAIPVLLDRRDLVGRAATGTGKTAAFALPLLHRLAVSGSTSDGGPPVGLVLVPTRELAVQVSEAIYKYGRRIRAEVVPVYGGQPIGRQLGALRRGVDIVVATPGRAIDHVRRGSLSLDSVDTVVLDEADEMLDMGFAEDIETLLSEVPPGRQTVLFSATMPPRIDKIARKHLSDPAVVSIEAPVTEPGEAPLVEQRVYVVRREHKPAALGRILDVENPEATIVFCRTRSEVDQLTETLNGRGYRAEALHGGMDQEQRDRVMGRLRSGTAELLVATDVAARGLDVDVLTHVVNYDVPSAAESYVHRIGRVGRAGRSGVAITLAEPRELRLLTNIERLTDRKIGTEKVPSVAELRARQQDQTAGSIEAALSVDDGGPAFEHVRPILDRLLGERSAEDIALAAIALLHEASGALTDEPEIPDASAPRADRRDRRDRADRPRRADRGDRFENRDRPPRRDLASTTTVAKVYIGAGRSANVRPQDLVGAIANETSLSGRDIGAIRISEHHSVVEVPAAAVDEVIAAMSQTELRGRRVTARRYVEHQR